MGQIARRIAEKLIREDPKIVDELGGLDPDVAEAAGLAHDLGHPPFGHTSEEELNKLVQSAGLSDGYEGNAQSFRIVTKLAISDARNADDLPLVGLNLSRQTLDGILKYPWGFGNNSKYPHKWGYYETEKEIFDWVRNNRPPLQRSLTAEIMDWADDITFAIHDLIDFFRAGRIPIDRCKGTISIERQRLSNAMFRRKKEWIPIQHDYEAALEEIVEAFRFNPDGAYTGSREDQAKLFDFSTSLINLFISSLHLRSKSNGDESLVEIEGQARRQVEVLKQFIWEYVIENPDLAVPQQGQKEAIRAVFELLMDATMSGKRHLLPPAYASSIDVNPNKMDAVRVVADCISGMTEKEIMHFYRRLRGLEI